MCLGSRIAEVTENAKMGETYGISKIATHSTSPGKVGALHAIGSSVKACVYCITTGQRVTLSNIPETLQRKFALKESAVATFNESKIWHSDDILDFGGNKRVQFREFADKGVLLYVGVKHETDQAVAGIIADANKAAEGDGGTVLSGELVDA